MKIFFVPALEGYIWSFPRPNHVSYGLISRSGPGRTARAKELLANFIAADLGHEVMAARGVLQRACAVPQSRILEEQRDSRRPLGARR